MANLSNINNYFIVDTAGQVAIGDVSSATLPTLQTQLTVYDHTGTAGVIIQSGGASGKKYELFSNASGTFGISDIGVGDRLTISSGGNATFAGTVQGTTARFDTLNNNANSANIIYRSGTNTIVGNNASALVVQDGGNVGIGTNSPNQLLELSKNGSPVMRLNSSKTTNGAIGDSIGRIEWRGSNNAGNGAGIKAAIDTSATSTTQRDFDILFKTGNNIGSGEPPTRMRIDADGNVGIGTVSPGAKLEVAGATNIKGTSNFAPVLTLGTAGAINAVINSADEMFFNIDSDNNQTSAAFWFGHNSTQGDTSSKLMVIKDSGNVGIGTTSPNATLEIGTPSGVAGSAGSVNRLFIAPFSNTGGPYKFIARTVSGASDFLDMYYGSNHIISYGLDGKVGIGTTTPGAKLEIDIGVGEVGLGVFTTGESTTPNVRFGRDDTQYIGFQIQDRTNTMVFRQDEGTGEHFADLDLWTSTNSNKYFRINNNDQSGNLISNWLTIKNSNVGIGTTAPSSRLHVSESKAGNVAISVQNTNASYSSQIRFLDSTGTEKSAVTFVPSDTSLRFFNNGADRMIITSGGLINMGDQAGSGAGRLNISANPSNNYQIEFFTSAGTSVGTITTSGGTTTNYNTTSDYRLKGDLQDFNGLDKVSKIPVYDFKWKSDESRSYGVMAHELQEVLPDAVSGEKDAEEMQGVDYSKIVPLLVKSIQELKADNDSLKARIETLENN